MPAARDFQTLAGLYGVQSAYTDVAGKRCQASRESLVRTLQIMGVPIDTPDDAGKVLAQSHEWKKSARVSPVIVAWNGRLPNVSIERRGLSGRVEAVVTLTDEDDQPREWRHVLSDAEVIQESNDAGQRTDFWRLPLSAKLPLGYYRLTVSLGDERAESLVIAAPRRAQSSAAEVKQWGVFAPMYAVRRDGSGSPSDLKSRDWGAGSVTEFGQFGNWVRGLGGTLVASLPLLASFFDGDWDVSPYAPASRLFWNEFFVDVTRAPEFEHCEDARRLAESNEMLQRIADLRSKPIVDYIPLMRLKRRVMELLAKRFFTGPAHRREAFEELRWSHPDLDVYARFRAVCERLGRPWMNWPHSLRDGVLPEEPADETARWYHLYAQWLAHEQFVELSQSARQEGMVWYLDLPLGTHPDGYDVWRYRQVFAMGASGGAPPDAFFTKGQSWGFPPLHPGRLREQKYEYFIRVLRHHLSQAGLLRIDHVMGLHRLYWVPDGHPASEGVYVRYPADELYAILLLEAHRHNASIIGENLGTVPSYVNRDMRSHGFGRLYVLQYELNSLHDRDTLRAPDADEVASLNTHDMPPFAAWWQAVDIDDRMDLGLLDQAAADAERAHRTTLKQKLMNLFRTQGFLAHDASDLPAVLHACLTWLAASDACVLLVQLEDLWLETESQNTPGTVSERVNWRRKARLSLEQLTAGPSIAATLQELDRIRRFGVR